jgi:hypothetical protein
MSIHLVVTIPIVGPIMLQYHRIDYHFRFLISYQLVYYTEYQRMTLYMYTDGDYSNVRSLVLANNLFMTTTMEEL